MNKSYCCRQPRPRLIDRCFGLFLLMAACSLLARSPYALAGTGDAPAWMHAQANAQLPEYDEKTDAVLLYSEKTVTVLATDRLRITIREAYKILRPNGREHGTVWVYLNPERKLRSLHGWCIPAQGRDYEVKDKDAVERAPDGGAEMVSDVRFKVLTIPAPDPGNIVGYEYEVEERPFYLQESWDFQDHDPVRESHFSLQLPAGWEFKASWLNHAEVKPVESGGNLWQWTLNDVKGIRHEPLMPPSQGVAGQMVVTFFATGAKSANGFAEWRDLGTWENQLIGERVEASPELKAQVATLTAGKNTQLEKMQAITRFIQDNIRYVAIELGIGGFQPHPAPEVFSHRYGDCKDKATLTRSMLHEVGIDTYAVVINDERGAITGDMPAHNGFNHMIVAMKLPEGVADPSLVAILQHPKLGRLLYFDPTDEITPFGQIRGELQDNYGLLVTPDGGELLPLPVQPPAMNSIERIAKLTIDPTGKLQGDVKEVRLGDRAWHERRSLRSVDKESDRIKPIENVLASSLTNFRITHASITNLKLIDKPFGFDYTFESDNYAKNAGGLLLVRPRVLGSKARNFLETKEPRRFPIEFEGAVRDSDTFEIAIPPGYAVDDMPPPVDADFSFASYHSKTEVTGSTIRYTRTFEVKELSVPVNRADELRAFYRTINGDERNTVVLKAVAH